jgi:pimeloyl-ACP methyl ester carboxylesterase
VIAIDSAGSGQPLVLLHGVGASRAIWHRAMPLLATHRRVVAADLPGFGESPASGRGFDLDEAAEALAAGLDGRVEVPFDLLGNSLGGAIAVALASRRPQLVGRLILSAPALFAPRNPLLARAAGAAAGQLIGARRLLGTPLASSAAGRRLMLFGAVGEPGRLPAEDARLMLTASRAASRIPEAITAVLATDLRSRLAELEVPTGLIWGERDRVVSHQVLRDIRALAPALAVETIPRAGHVPQLERPREFAAAVERLLARLAAVTVS